LFICLVIIFQAYSELFVKSHNFFLLHLYLAPLLWVIPLEFRQDFWLQKTIVCIVWVMVCLAVLIEPTCDSDRHTDGQTQCHSIYHASMAVPSGRGPVYSGPMR